MSTPTTAWEAEANGWSDDDWRYEDVVEGDAHGDAGDPRTGRDADPSVPPETGVALKCAEQEIAESLRPVASGIHVSRASAAVTASPVTRK